MVDRVALHRRVHGDAVRARRDLGAERAAPDGAARARRRRAREAGVLCGVAIALGVLITGRGLLDRVAFQIVEVDRVTATTAQLVQALVVLVAVSFGYFTSMNQALVGAMAGARPRAVERRTLRVIVRGWLLVTLLLRVSGHRTVNVG